MVDEELISETARRRTFAIISHPDAGKTTLTEKLLLYAGQIDVAGAVRGRKTQRAVTSDWMALERERGISVSATALSFEYRAHRLNLLDTPGHQDFSEDTYRSLAAADSAVMVLDVANGVETQTRKLFRVCAARRIPILTLINKMDRLGKDPLDLLAEVESDLGIEPVPVNWPVGLGEHFQGVVDRLKDRVLLFSPTEGGSLQVPTRIVAMQDLDKELPGSVVKGCRDALELLDGAGGSWDKAKFLAGKLTPVFFASAANNYGIEPFLDTFVKLATSPGPRSSLSGPIPADRPHFAGQVFKIQANLNPKHRDRMAFVRVCAGRFTSELEPTVARTGEKLRFKGAHQIFARDRAEVDSAFPGDVVGLAFTKGLRLGDTLYDGPKVEYDGLPRFSPECFAIIRCPDLNRRKQMAEGLQQLADEGAVQMFVDPTNSREMILAAVGVLQFDVVTYRLEIEYGVKTEIETTGMSSGAWLQGDSSVISNYRFPAGTRLVQDHRRQPVLLVEDPFTLRFLQKREPGLGVKPFSEDLFAPQQ